MLKIKIYYAIIEGKDTIPLLSEKDEKTKTGLYYRAH